MSQGQDLVDNMERVWRSIEDLCRDLTEEEWKPRRIAPDGRCRTSFPTWRVPSRES